MEVRAAIAADYDAYASLFPELGVDDPLPSRARFESELAARIVVAVAGDRVVGYALFEVLAETGYVRNIVSGRAHRRTGVGVALMSAMRERFVAAGATSWCLNVKPTNVAAIALYERFGLAAAYRSTVVRIPREVALPEAADYALVPIPPDTDSVIEPAFHLLRGQLASSRSKGGRHVVQLVRGTNVLAIGVFATAIPGAFPCRIVDPTHAAALVTHLRTLAPEGAAWVQIGVEDDAPFATELVRLGAWVNLEIQHMTGSLSENDNPRSVAAPGTAANEG